MEAATNPKSEKSVSQPILRIFYKDICMYDAAHNMQSGIYAS
jgi:hypothetical protein